MLLVIPKVCVWHSRLFGRLLFHCHPLRICENVLLVKDGIKALAVKECESMSWWPWNGTVFSETNFPSLSDMFLTLTSSTLQVCLYLLVAQFMAASAVRFQPPS
jgi:hypothetical protein